MAILHKRKNMYSPSYCSDGGQQQIPREKFKNRGNIQDSILRIFSHFLPVYNLRISWNRSCVFVFNTFQVFLPHECIQLLLKSSSWFLNSKLYQIWSRSSIKTLFVYTKIKKCITESTTYEFLLQNTYINWKIQKLVTDAERENYIGQTILIISIIVPYLALDTISRPYSPKERLFCKVQSHKRCGFNYQETKGPQFYILPEKQHIE